jgi:hypothetical protein
MMWFNPRAPIPDQIRFNGQVTNTADLLTNYQPGEMVSLRSLNTERRPQGPYDPFAFVIPMGMGIKFKVTNNIDIAAEVTGRITFTDYLDDVSRIDYPDPSEFDYMNSEREMLALIMSKPTTSGLRRRGSPDTNDYYMIFNVKADFYIPTPDALRKLFGSRSSFGSTMNNKKLMNRKQKNRGRR